MRTPMGWCGSISPKGATSQRSRMNRCKPSLHDSMSGHARRLVFKHRMPYSSPHHLLHFVVESANTFKLDYSKGFWTPCYVNESRPLRQSFYPLSADTTTPTESDAR